MSEGRQAERTNEDSHRSKTEESAHDPNNDQLEGLVGAVANHQWARNAPHAIRPRPVVMSP